MGHAELDRTPGSNTEQLRCAVNGVPTRVDRDAGASTIRGLEPNVDYGITFWVVDSPSRFDRWRWDLLTRMPRKLSRRLHQFGGLGPWWRRRKRRRDWLDYFDDMGGWEPDDGAAD